MDPLLYGHNPEERIVAVHQLNDQSIRLFKRIEGKILHKDVEFFPFFFLAEESLISGFPKKFWLKKLTGDNYYRFIAAFSRWSEMWEAVHFILKQYNKARLTHLTSYMELKEILIRTDPVRQFLLQSGVTFFKGMEFEDLVRLHIDVQSVPVISKNRRSRERKTEEQISVITLLADDGKKYVLKKSGKNELEILKQIIERINEIDPDVIEGYDLFGTILPVIVQACERQQISFAIGRNGSDMRVPGGFSSQGSSDTDWYSYDVFGRHLVDISAVAEAELNTRRTELHFGLHSLARQFGISGQETKEQKKTLKMTADQSLKNAGIEQEISNLLLPTLFYLAQLCPFNFKMLIHTGTTSRIESLMLREYVREKHSVPKPMEGSRNINIAADIYRTGVFSDVDYIELEGLYPSIIRRQNIKPRNDKLNIFPALLKSLSALQKEILEKQRMENNGKSDLVTFLNLLKRLLDSLHISLGYSKGLFNDPDGAENVISSGKEILKEITRQIEIFNAEIIQSDDRGFFLLMPDNIIGKTKRKNFIDRLSKTLPEGTNLVLSNHFKKMFSYRKNNYALMDKNDNVMIKGNSIISRGTERYLRIFIRRFIECLLTNDITRLHHLYATAYTQIIRHEWNPEDFCKVEIARMDTETYRNELSDGRVSPSPAMEATVRSSLFVKAGTKISYYFTGTEADINQTGHSRLAEEWDPLKTDENTNYYLAKLHETINKFKEFFEPAALERIFSLDDIFGFSDKGIRILEHIIAPDIPDNKPETEDYNIWLAEED